MSTLRVRTSTFQDHGYNTRFSVYDEKSPAFTEFQPNRLFHTGFFFPISSISDAKLCLRVQDTAVAVASSVQSKGIIKFDTGAEGIQ